MYTFMCVCVHGGNKQGTCLLRGRLSGFLLNNPHEKPQAHSRHTLTTCGIHLTLQHYCLGWVLFPHLSIETATLERLERGIPLICPSHLAGRHSTLSLAVQTETEESPDRAH